MYYRNIWYRNAKLFVFIKNLKDMDIKEALNKFYDKANPERIDYNCNSDDSIHELRKLRDAFYNESSKYQEMIDRKIMEKFDALKYAGQYIRRFCNGESYEIDYIKCTKVERVSYGIRIHGIFFRCYRNGDYGIDVDSYTEPIKYCTIDEELEIITKEEYRKDIKTFIENISEKFLK